MFRICNLQHAAVYFFLKVLQNVFNTSIHIKKKNVIMNYWNQIQ